MARQDLHVGTRVTHTVVGPTSSGSLPLASGAFGLTGNPQVWRGEGKRLEDGEDGDRGVVEILV